MDTFRSVLVAPASASITYAVGGILAKIHGLALAVDRISPWHPSRVSEAGWHELAARARAKGAVWASTLTGLLPVLLDLRTLGEGAPTPSPVLTINVLGPGSVRSRGMLELRLRTGTVGARRRRRR